MPEPETIGVPVFRHMGDWTPYAPDCACAKEPHRAIPLDAASLAKVRETLADLIFETTTDFTRLNDYESGRVADAVLSALGLVTPGDAS